MIEFLYEEKKPVFLLRCDVARYLVFYPLPDTNTYWGCYLPEIENRNYSDDGRLLLGNAIAFSIYGNYVLEDYTGKPVLVRTDEIVDIDLFEDTDEEGFWDWKIPDETDLDVIDYTSRLELGGDLEW